MLLRHVTRKQGRNYCCRAVMYPWISWWTIWRIWKKRGEINAKSPEWPQATRGRSAVLMLCLWMTDNCVIRNTKSVRIMWRKCQLKRKILVGRADIVTWRSRYLKEVQDYGDNGHLMLYVHKTWTDSNLTFHNCWQEGEVMGIRTDVNTGNRLIMLCIGGIGGFLPLCTSHLQG